MLGGCQWCLEGLVVKLVNLTMIWESDIVEIALVSVAFEVPQLLGYGIKQMRLKNFNLAYKWHQCRMNQGRINMGGIFTCERHRLDIQLFIYGFELLVSLLHHGLKRLKLRWITIKITHKHGRDWQHGSPTHRFGG